MPCIVAPTFKHRPQSPPARPRFGIVVNHGLRLRALGIDSSLPLQHNLCVCGNFKSSRPGPQATILVSSATVEEQFQPYDITL